MSLRYDRVTVRTGPAQVALLRWSEQAVLEDVNAFLAQAGQAPVKSVRFAVERVGIPQPRPAGPEGR